ncbi:MAG: hypothetical protein ACYC9K_09910 [Sulfuricaulis sp.]
MTLHLPHQEPLRTFPKLIEADNYNRVRLALKRLPRPLRVELPDHRGLDALLDDDGWLVVDTLQADQPVLAWVEFGHRSALHEPVACVLKLYHVHAGLVMGTALEALDKALKQRLAELP